LEIFEIRTLYAIVLIQILHYKVLFFFLKFLSLKLANKRIGDAFYDRGHKDEAEKHYRQCIEIASQMTLDVIQERFELYKEIIFKCNPYYYL
jgi:hypothetical protein